MEVIHNEAVRELLRRVDEVRGLSSASDVPASDVTLDSDGLIRALTELVNELERSHRRLIETNVQLVSLREVASDTLSALDGAETARRVTRYLGRAFGFGDVFLLFVNAEEARLEGAWTHTAGGRDQAHALEVPLIGNNGAVARALWLNRSVVHHSPRRHPPAFLPGGHPLEEAFGRLRSVACVPLGRSHVALPGADPHELCGADCILGEVGSIAPDIEQSTEEWGADREARQTRCLRCAQMPTLGVIGIARRLDEPPLGAADLSLLESIALSIAPLVENARLYQELRRSERFRHHVLDSMASALVAVNLKGEILSFNRAAADLLGLTEEHSTGQPFGAVLGTDGEALLRDALEDGREAQRAETQLRAHDGSPVPVSLTTSLLRDDRRSVYGAIATFVDLTPLKRAEEHVRRVDRLAALGRFTSSVAHEIRNPLTGIAAGIQYLERSVGADDPQRENFEFILSEVRRLDRIVGDLFDITHPRRLMVRAAAIEEPLRRALLSLDALIQERALDVRLVIAPRTPVVPYDADQMQQVFINLIKNAAEASPNGSTITIQVASIAATPRGAGALSSGPSVAVRVEDRGNGIAAEHLKTIFEPFFTTKPGGTGLGLYICHDIVKRHGGSLTVTSDPGRGAAFTVELPVDANGGMP